MKIKLLIKSFLAAATACFFPLLSFAQFAPQWNQTSNPGGVNDANAITGDASGIYVAGTDYSPGNYEWHIEKRDLTTGALIAAFGTGGTVTSNPTSSDDEANGITIDTSGIYVAGTELMCLGCDAKWHIEKYNLTTGALIWTQTSNPSLTPDGSNTITVDTSGIYVAGTVGVSIFNCAWRVEKRSLTTGVPIWGQTIDVSPALDIPYAIAADTSGIYVAGFDFSSGNEQWRIEKRDLNTGLLIWAQASNPSVNPDYAQAITADAGGIYVAGFDMIPGNTDPEWRIEKRDLTAGALVASFGTGGVISSNPTTDVDYANAITVNASGIYIAGTDMTPGNEEWRIEKRDLTTGALTCSVTSNASASSDETYAIAIDTSGIYVAGIDFIPGNEEWRIEKYDLCSIVSVESISPGHDIFSVYPNPFSSEAVLHTGMVHNATLTVENIFGQVVRQVENIRGASVILNRGNLPAGIYFMQLTGDNNIIAVKKFVIAD
ncbi:MAG TPA: T9SS type A sorting domain-containing protein [Bacteroidia bacterium]|nr:T9SS type A sorting domain-containing protein [Bacteroidia bacterium]